MSSAMRPGTSMDERCPPIDECEEYEQEDAEPQEPGEEEVDEWALLNELDMTVYQYEQQKRRRDEYMGKKKVRDDLIDQMREKCDTQARMREQEELEWRQQEERLADWNECEELREKRDQRRKDRMRQMLLRQADEATAAKRKVKNDELELGRQTAAQIREDICLERERAIKDRMLAHEEYQENCRQNELLRIEKERLEEQAAQQDQADTDMYFRRQAMAEEERQRQIADRYNNCRLRENVVGEKIDQIGAQSTYFKKSEQQLTNEMEEAGKIFDLKEEEKRIQREQEKRRALADLQDQIRQKEVRRSAELETLLHTVGDIRDAVNEHALDAKAERLARQQHQREYGQMLRQQYKEHKKKVEYRGMTPNERRINLPLLEKLRDSCAAEMGPGVPTTRTVTPFSERASSRGSNINARDERQRAAKIRQKVKKDSISFG